MRLSRIPAPRVWLGVLFSAALIACAIARGRWWRAASGAALAALLALLLWHAFAPETHRGQLEMSVIDVRQGDGILVIFRHCRRLLVDGGGLPAFGRQTRSQLDIGEDGGGALLVGARYPAHGRGSALARARRPISARLPALVSDFHPVQLWTGATPDSPSRDALRASAEASTLKIVPLAAPNRFALGGAEIDVLAPFPDYVPSDAPKNDDSLVLRIRYGRHVFLLTGDVERPIERRMPGENEIRHADVLKVAHHGSPFSHRAVRARRAVGLRRHLGGLREQLRAPAQGRHAKAGRSSRRSSAKGSRRTGLHPERRAPAAGREARGECGIPAPWPP